MDWKDYLSANAEVMALIDSEKVSSFFEEINRVRSSGGTVWVLGNGGSASAASHAVADFGKTSKSGGARPVFTVAPSEMISMQTAYANDVSFEQGFALTLRDFAKAGDAVWVISVSGKSPNLLAAAEVAAEMNLTLLSTVGSAGEELAQRSKVGLVIPSADYQIVENGHVILMHWFTKLLAVKSV